MIEVLASKDILAVASPIIKSIVEKFIIPKINGFYKKFDLDRKKYHVPTSEHFSEYFHRTYKKVSFLNTLVFNNAQLHLKDIYQPLSIAMPQKNGKELVFKIDSCPVKLINDFEKILITDTAGMGKSTLMKRIFLDIIDRELGVPILIELRRLTKEQTIIKEIHEQINSINKEFDSELLLEFINEGGFAFILDGYDEISLADKETVTKDIQKFIVKASNNRFILTSRPENALKSFGDFQQFTIQPLKKKEAFELLRKYDKTNTISSLLIKKLEESEMGHMDEFLINPLLVTLLYTAFQHKQSIPFKKYLFYRQVFDANFETHDLTKGDSYNHDKFSKLEIDDFHRVLRHIGFMCFRKQRIEFVKDELLSIISQSKESCIGLNFNESDFLKDLLSKVPLFIEDGNFYRWAHKSLQEYFAAQYLYLDEKTHQKDILITMLNHKEIEKFSNILDLFYDIDIKSFRNILLLEIFNDFKSFYNSSYKELSKTIPQNLIIQRKELTFYLKSYIFRDKLAQGPKFNDEEIGKMIKNITSEEENLNMKFQGIMITSNNLNDPFSFYLEDKKRLILQILDKKRNPCIEHFDKFSKQNAPVFTDVFKSDFEYLEINDNLENPLNTPQNFEKTNRMIENCTINNFKINSIVALKELDEIIKSKKEDNSGKFSFEDL